MIQIWKSWFGTVCEAKACFMVFTTEAISL